MEIELLIVRYGEIGLKAKETRKRFENTLVNNIKNALTAKKISFRIKREWGRIYVYSNQMDESVLVLQKVFGVTSISPAVQTNSDIDSISEISTGISREVLRKDKSFALRVKRTGNHSYTSQDVAIRIGYDVVKATEASVNLTKPDFELFIEIRDKNAYIFTQKIHGTAGLPLGTQGKALALITDPKSILAAWYIMHRGCKTFFANTDDRYTKMLHSFITDWYANTGIYMVEPNGKNFYRNLNRIISKKNCDAVVTGNTFFDDFQKELYVVKLLKKHVKLPILNPLIALEEDEINQKCREIGISI